MGPRHVGKSGARDEGGGGGPHRAVAEVNPGDQLLEVVAGLVFGEAAHPQDPLKQLTPRSILHHDAQVMPC